MTDIVYLKVPFKDKEIVKALGARWNGKNWFVPADQAVVFKRWVVKEESVSDTTESREKAVKEGVQQKELKESPVVSSTGEKVGSSLASFLFEISEVVRKSMVKSRWVFAEIASIRKNAHSGHIYLELVEHDVSGKEIAKVNARIWATQQKILNRFEKETGGPVQDGMKLLLLVQGDFSIQYGFGLTIEDIDATWTMGEMQKKNQEIRQALKKEGLFDLNKNKNPLKDFTRVALIAPEGAAGLGDFLADAQILEQHGLCEFKIIHAVFEGQSTVPSMVKALSVAQSWAEEGLIEAVVVVRGGGAKTSLNWLNDYQIARKVCETIVPVMVGIGHERDSTLLDEVSCESFDTPSKVIGAIAQRIITEAQKAKENFNGIRQYTQQQCHQAEKVLTLTMNDVNQQVQHRLAQEKQKVGYQWEEVKTRSDLFVKQSKKQVEGWVREVVGLGPATMLNRGYSVVQQQGQVKNKVSDLNPEETMTVRMSDGSVQLKWIKVDPSNSH